MRYLYPFLQASSAQAISWYFWLQSSLNPVGSIAWLLFSLQMFAFRKVSRAELVSWLLSNRLGCCKDHQQLQLLEELVQMRDHLRRLMKRQRGSLLHRIMKLDRMQIRQHLSEQCQVSLLVHRTECHQGQKQLPWLRVTRDQQRSHQP